MILTRKLITISLIAIAILLLYPGVTQPVLTLSGTVDKSKIAELGIALMTERDATAQPRQLLTAFPAFWDSIKSKGNCRFIRARVPFGVPQRH